MLLQKLRQIDQNGKILLNHWTNVGALNFDGNSHPIRCDRAVHLSDRGTRDRLLIKFQERHFHRLPKLTGKDLLGQASRESGDIILKLAEFLIVGVIDQIAAGTQDLTELDEGGPQLL